MKKKYFYNFFVRCIWRVGTRIVAAPKNGKPKIVDASTDRVGTVIQIFWGGIDIFSYLITIQNSGSIETIQLLDKKPRGRVEIIKIFIPSYKGEGGVRLIL